jgi:EmrB/QacA subfamily drug resistance transporter
MTATHDAPSTPGGSPYLSHRQILAILSGLMLGMFLASLDQTIVSTAMRTIADRLDGQTAQAWATTAYLVTSTVSTPLYGKLSDIYGRKPFYLFAIGIFVVGSVLCGQAHSMYELAGFRALQGLGAGGLMSMAFAIIGDVVPARERARYQGYTMSVFATSSVLGPVLGGFFAGHDSLLGIDGWRWIFYVNVPIGLLALWVVQRNLRLPNRRSEHSIDYLGATTLVAAVVPVLLVAEKGREWGWGSVTTLSLLGVSLVSLAILLPWESRLGDEAILPLRIFRVRNFRVISVVAFLLGIGMFGTLVLMPLYLQIVKGASPTHAGLQMVWFMIGMMGASIVSGRLMRKTGRYRLFPIVGTAIASVGSLLLSTLTVDSGPWQIRACMVVMGIGLGLSMQMLMIAAQNALPMSDMGLSTATTTFFRAMGGTFGAAISLAVLFSTVLGNIKERLLDAGIPAAYVDRVNGKALDNTTTLLGSLPPAIKHQVLAGFADSMHTVFLVTTAILVPAFIGTLLIKEEPLREHSAFEMAQLEEPATL